MPQTLINLKTDDASVLAENAKIKSIVDDLNREFHGEGRVLLRPSGTEPVLRVMVEGSDTETVQIKAQQLTEEIRNIAAKLKSA